MPKPTFLNLDEAKRERFLAAADQEFALHDYAQASVSRIVAELGIAKGSLYQYFDDKQELYLYLIERAATAKLESIPEELGPYGEHEGFFAFHTRLILAGANFDLRNPHFSLILYRGTQDTTGPEAAGISRELRARSAEFLRGFVEVAIERGEVRSDIDRELTVHVTNTMTLALEPYLKSKCGYTHLGQLHDPDSPLPFTPEDLEGDVRDLVSVMRSGLEA
ncbi:MAG: TetR/AcrR family transcriptional regulator [Spirochaetota bacterium]